MAELEAPPLWWPCADADRDAAALLSRHYSWRKYRDRRRRAKFVGPGEYSCLITTDSLAVFVWRKFIDRCEFAGGINCAAFRNEGPHRSSVLILEAMALAWARWPGERLYTYVNPKRIASRNPGYCFKCAGWEVCGVTKRRGLVVLEVRP